MKYELDKASGLLRVDRVLFSAVHYPANNGFVPRTYCDDGDPLEILAYCQEPIESLAIMRARIIGVMKMHDEKGEDDKLISVHAGYPDYDGVVDLAGLPAFRMRELRRFFQDHKSLENKKALVSDPQGRREALQAVRGASKPYQREKERLLDTDGGGPCRPPAPRLHPARRGRG